MIENPMIAALKVFRVIASCETVEQLRVASRMATLAAQMHADKPGYWVCTITMDERIRRRWFQITMGQRLVDDFIAKVRGPDDV